MTFFTRKRWKELRKRAVIQILFKNWMGRTCTASLETAISLLTPQKKCVQYMCYRWILDGAHRSCALVCVRYSLRDALKRNSWVLSRAQRCCVIVVTNAPCRCGPHSKHALEAASHSVPHACSISSAHAENNNNRLHFKRALTFRFDLRAVFAVCVYGEAES